MKIAILLFNNFTALDVVGPYEVLSRLPDTKIYFVGPDKKDYEDSYGLKMLAEYSINDISEADVLLIPGGYGVDDILKNTEIIEWIKKIDRTSKWTVSVCSGALLLAEAGLLIDKKCTTHWKRKDQLRNYKVDVINERYVHDGKIITSAGVSAGIDMALYMVSIIENEQAAKMIQLSIEYDPNPPFDCGSPDKVPQEMIDKLKK